MSLILTEHKDSSEELLSFTAHELRTSLSVIKWYTEMLLDGDCGALQDGQVKYLKTIQSSNQKAIDLIRSVLNVSRLDLGTFSISPEEVDISSLVDEILLELKKKVEDKKVFVEKSFDFTEKVLLDKQMCNIVLRNIISNAVLFSHEGGRVVVSVKEIKEGEECGAHTVKQDSVVVGVTDFGIGISQEDIPHILSTFFYKTSNVTNENKGVGLGLYITRLILEKTKGEIWFTSTENIGSTFYVAFPRSGMEKKEGRTKLD